MLRAISLHMTVWELLPGLALYGMGIGFALAQLTNVVLSEIPADGSGVASGANTTVRQVGSALGVAVIGSLLTVQTVNHAVSRIRGAALPAAVKVNAIAGVHASGANYSPPRGLSPANAATLRSAVEHGVTSGTRLALMFAFVVVAIGTVVSFLVPNSAIPADDRKTRALEGFEPLEPLDADPALLG
jgi:hypothetical protein